jgi:hypothetical protein
MALAAAARDQHTLNIASARYKSAFNDATDPVEPVPAPEDDDSSGEVLYAYNLLVKVTTISDFRSFFGRKTQLTRLDLRVVARVLRQSWRKDLESMEERIESRFDRLEKLCKRRKRHKHGKEQEGGELAVPVPEEDTGGGSVERREADSEGSDDVNAVYRALWLEYLDAQAED